MNAVSLPVSFLAAGILLVVLACYTRAVIKQPFSPSLLLTISLALAYAALAAAGWSDLAEWKLGQGVAKVGGAVIVAILGVYLQNQSQPRALLTEAIVHRLAPNDSRRFLFFTLLFLVSLMIAPWLFHVDEIAHVLISLGFGALFTLVACIIEFEVMRAR